MTNEEKKIKIETLTPLWTGDIDGNCNRVKETGIIGSLRWWYEELVKVGGYDVCKKGQGSSGENSCPVCDLFGNTEQKKRFGLRVSGNFRNSNFVKYHFPGRPDNKSNWYLNPGLLSEDGSRLEIWNIFPGDNVSELIRSLFGFLAENAGIGARTQFGYGIIDHNSFDYNLNLLKEKIGSVEEKKLFFSKINFEINDNAREQIFSSTEGSWKQCKKNGYLPTSPYFRYKLRESLREEGFESNQRHELMGNFNETNSNIKISHLYRCQGNKKEMRVWGKIPENNPKTKEWVEKLQKKDFWQKKTEKGLKAKKINFKWLEEIL